MQRLIFISAARLHTGLGRILLIGGLSVIGFTKPCPAEVSLNAPGPADILRRIPDFSSPATRLADGGYMLVLPKMVLFSKGNPLLWNAVALRVPHAGATLIPIGGAESAIFFLCNTNGLWPGRPRGFFLACYRPGRGWKFLREVGQRPASFASSTLGAIAMGRNIVITADGGVTLRPYPPLLKRRGNRICLLQWVGTDRLLIASDFGTVRLLRVGEGGVPRPLWKSALKPRVLHASGAAERLFIRTLGHLYKLDARSGRVTADYKLNRVGLSLRVASVPESQWLFQVREFHGNLIASGFGGLSLWRHGPGGGLSKVWQTKKLQVTDIFPLKSGCLVVGTRGSLYHLDLGQGKLTPTSVAIRGFLGASRLTARAGAIPSAAEIKECFSLLKLVPKDVGRAIVKRVLATKGLTRRQIIERTLKELRTAIARADTPDTQK